MLRVTGAAIMAGAVLRPQSNLAGMTSAELMPARFQPDSENRLMTTEIDLITVQLPLDPFSPTVIRAEFTARGTIERAFGQITAKDLVPLLHTRIPKRHRRIGHRQPSALIPHGALS